MNHVGECRSCDPIIPLLFAACPGCDFKVLHGVFSPIAVRNHQQALVLFLDSRPRYAYLLEDALRPLYELGVGRLQLLDSRIKLIDHCSTLLARPLIQGSLAHPVMHEFVAQLKHRLQLIEQSPVVAKSTDGVP